MFYTCTSSAKSLSISPVRFIYLTIIILSLVSSFYKLTFNSLLTRIHYNIKKKKEKKRGIEN